MSAKKRGPSKDRRPLEDALRYLGCLKRGDLHDVIEHALVVPHPTSGKALAPLVQPTADLRDWTALQRSHAILAMINEGVHDRTVGPTAQSRRRRALQA